MHARLPVSPGARLIDERQSVLHSWCVQSQWSAPTVVGGDGAWLVLEGGRRVLDMSSLAECSNLGHQHPRVVAAIRAQAADEGSEAPEAVQARYEALLTYVDPAERDRDALLDSLSDLFSKDGGAPPAGNQGRS